MGGNAEEITFRPSADIRKLMRWHGTRGFLFLEKLIELQCRMGV